MTAPLKSGKRPSKRSSGWVHNSGKCASFSASRESVRSRPMFLARSLSSRERFPSKFKLWKYSRLSITDRSSDGTPLGYQRLDRSGNRELKTLSYHAWRTACKSTTGPNAIKSFYQASKERTHDVRHARLNTQRKILEAMWQMWLRCRPFDPNKFFPITANASTKEVKAMP